MWENHALGKRCLPDRIECFLSSPPSFNNEKIITQPFFPSQLKNNADIVIILLVFRAQVYH